jgi:hypothetical protein
MMTKAKIEGGMKKYNLIIQELGDALPLFDDAAPESQYKVRRSLARGTWTVRTMKGEKVMVLRQGRGGSIPVIGDSTGSIGRMKRWSKGPQK